MGAEFEIPSELQEYFDSTDKDFYQKISKIEQKGYRKIGKAKNNIEEQIDLVFKQYFQGGEVSEEEHCGEEERYNNHLVSKGYDNEYIKEEITQRKLELKTKFKKYLKETSLKNGETVWYSFVTKGRILDYHNDFDRVVDGFKCILDTTPYIPKKNPFISDYEESSYVCMEYPTESRLFDTHIYSGGGNYKYLQPYYFSNEVVDMVLKKIEELINHDDEVLSEDNLRVLNGIKNYFDNYYELTLYREEKDNFFTEEQQKNNLEKYNELHKKLTENKIGPELIRLEKEYGEWCEKTYQAHIVEIHSSKDTDKLGDQFSWNIFNKDLESTISELGDLVYGGDYFFDYISERKQQIYNTKQERLGVLRKKQEKKLEKEKKKTLKKQAKRLKEEEKENEPLSLEEKSEKAQAFLNSLDHIQIKKNKKAKLVQDFLDYASYTSGIAKEPNVFDYGKMLVVFNKERKKFRIVLGDKRKEGRGGLDGMDIDDLVYTISNGGLESYGCGYHENIDTEEDDVIVGGGSYMYLGGKKIFIGNSSGDYGKMSKDIVELCFKEGGYDLLINGRGNFGGNYDVLSNAGLIKDEDGE